MVDINLTVSIINSNMNGLNTPIKRQTVRVDKKIQLYVVFKKPTLQIKTQVKRDENIYYSNTH